MTDGRAAKTLTLFRKWLAVPFFAAVIATGCDGTGADGALGGGAQGPSDEGASADEEVARARIAGLTALPRPTAWTATATVNSSTAGNAVDTNTTTVWTTSTSQASASQALTIDMKSRRSFVAMSLNASAATTNYLRSYTVKVSNDGTTWSSAVATATGNTSVLTTISFAPQSARYVQVTQNIAAGVTNFWSVSDVQVYGTALSPAVWTLSASSGNTTTELGRAIDANASTRWSSTSTANSQWFKIDMKSPQTFNQIVLDAGTTTNDYPRNYSVFVSNDDMNWGTAVASGAGTTAFIVIPFPFQRARYIRIDATRATTGSPIPPWSIQELSVEGQPTLKVAHPRGGWVASSNSSGGSTGPLLAVDSSTTTRWRTAANQAANQYFQVDMLTRRNIEEIRLDAGAASTEYPRTFKVQVANTDDVATWAAAPVVATSGSGTTVMTIAFTPQTARYVRITLTGPAAVLWSIYDFNAYGSALSRPGWVAKASATSGSNTADLTLDGTVSTRWTSGVPQAEGQWFQVDMLTPQVFNQLTLDAGNSTGQDPKTFTVRTSNDGTTFGPELTLAPAPVVGSSTNQLATTINFATQTARYVRVSLTAVAATNWSIHEFHVWRIVGLCDSLPELASCSDNNACNGLELCITGACNSEPAGARTTCSSTTRVTFYQSFNSTSKVADIATSGQTTPNADNWMASLVPSPGLFGAGIDSSTEPWITYRAYSLANPASVTFGKPGSASIWVKMLPNYVPGQLLIAYSASGYLSVTDSATGFVATLDASRSVTMPRPATWAADGQWHLVVVNWSQNRLQLIVDGVASALSASAPPPSVPAVFDPGNAIVAGGSGSGAYRDELLYLNRPLTMAEIAWYYAQRNPPAGTVVNPAILQFDQTAGGCNAADDLNPCTTDSCTTAFSYVVASNGAPCSDSNACNGAETCQAGTCTAGAPPSCPGATPCATACSPSTGCITPVQTPEGGVCVDGNPYTPIDTCIQGSCRGSIAPPPTPPSVTYGQLFDLGAVEGNDSVGAAVINDAGITAGMSAPIDPWIRPSAGPMQAVMFPSGGFGYVHGINAQGVIAGYMTPTVDESQGHFGFTAAVGQTAIVRPLIAGVGTIQFSGINDSNALSGTRYLGGTTYRPARVTGGANGPLTVLTGPVERNPRSTTLQDPPTSFNDCPATGLDIAANGQVVGWLHTFESSDFVEDDGYHYNNNAGVRRAIRSKTQSPSELEFVSIPENALSQWRFLAEASATNGDQITGWGVTRGSNRCHAFRYTISSRELIDLGVPPSLVGQDVCGDVPGRFEALEPQDINNLGEIVGKSHYSEGAFYYSSGLNQIFDLQDLVDPATRAHITAAYGINDSGEVVGNMWIDGAPQVGHAFKMKLPDGVRRVFQTVKPRVDGYVDLGAAAGAGRYLAVFGYENTGPEVTIPRGTGTNRAVRNNDLTAPVNPPPPVQFLTGTKVGAFLPKVELGDSITWNLAGGSKTITITPSTLPPPLTTHTVGTNGIAVDIPNPDPAHAGEFITVTVKPDTGAWANTPAVDPSPATPQPRAVGSVFNGVLKGELSVGPTGAATYTVPIVVPPGVAGMAPNLSLTYNSQAGDGIAGQGWQLSGLSVIHRCPKTRASDGYARPVHLDFLDHANLDDNDGICLDGQRLFERSVGVYESERKDFSVIRRGRETGYQGPSEGQIFMVETKSGEKRYYGSTDASRLVNPGNAWSNAGQIALWALDKVVDAWGNYLTVQYNPQTEFLTKGMVVKSINYSGHQPGALNDPSTPPGTAETPTFSWVHFDHEERKDIRQARFGDLVLPQRYRLKAVTTPIGSYGLIYATPDDSILPSRLSEIRYCAAGGTPCMEPLVFGWDWAPYSWVPDQGYAPPVRLNVNDGVGPAVAGSQIVDINGDGLVDFVFAKEGVTSSACPSGVWINSGQGWNAAADCAPSSWALPAKLVRSNGERAGVVLADFNGDGLPDVIKDRDGQGLPTVWLNRFKSGLPWQEATALHSALPSGWGPLELGQTTSTQFDRVVDMNGDGYADLVHSEVVTSSVHSKVALNNQGSGWFSGAVLYGTTFVGDIQDINRDGLPDLVNGTTARLNTNSVLRGENLTVWKPVTIESNPELSSAARQIGDIDGDGRYDVVVREYKGSSEGFKHQVAFSGDYGYTLMGPGAPVGTPRGSGYLPSLAQFTPPVTASPYTSTRIALADFNADGLVDVVLNRWGEGQLLINTGDAWRDLNGADDWSDGMGPNPVPGFLDEQPRAANELGEPSAAAYPDINGDGVPDVVKTSNETFSQSWAWRNTFRPPVIKEFPNGLARKSVVTYNVITQKDHSAYSDSGTLAPGTTNLAVPLRVATSVAQDNGLGELLPTTYQYQNMRGSSQGRGPLGFELVTASDPTGVTTVTKYSQTYPYIGMPLEVRKAKVGQPVTTTITDYCDTIVESGGTPQCSNIPATTPKTSRFVYPMRIVDTSSLRTSAIASAAPVGELRTETTFRYDAFGNPVRTTVTTTSPGGEAFSKETVNVYGTPGSEEERQGKATETTVSTRQTGPTSKPPLQRKTKFQYGVVNRFRGLYVSPPSSPSNAYFDTLGMTKRIVEPDYCVPGNPNCPKVEVHTAYEYDRFGNVTATTDCDSNFSECSASSPDPTFRTTKVSYDPAHWVVPSGPGSLSYTAGRFPVRTTNAEGHEEFYQYESNSGQLAQVQGPNGVRTCYQYDAFQRKRLEISRCSSAGEVTTTIERFYSTGADPGFAKTVTRTTPPVGSSGRSWVYGDSLGRTVGTVTEAFAGGFVQTLTTYERLGRPWQTSKPFDSSSSGQIDWTTNEYHALGHLSKVTQSLASIDGTTNVAFSVTTNDFEYSAGDGFTSVTRHEITGANGRETRTRRERKNGLGKTAWVEENGKRITYGYDAEGSLTEVRDSAPIANVTTILYDVRGRKTTSIDPDLGTWTYSYNGFGEVVTQKAPAQPVNQPTTMTYDRLGRLRTKTDSTGTAHWVYDVGAGAGKGKLAAVVSPADIRADGMCSILHTSVGEGKWTGKSFAYTGFGDLAETTECVDGNTFVTTNQYDEFGRPDVLTYPALADGSRLKVKYKYTRLGHLYTVVDPTDESVYWAAKAMNAAGQVTVEYTRNGVETTSSRNPSTGWLMGSTSVAKADGNRIIQKWGYQYDEAGNLRKRFREDQINIANSEEIFDYDALDRVTSSRVKVALPGQPYDVTEPYVYDAAGLGNLTEKGGKTYTYGTCGAGPHAVCQVTGSAPFTYDANGNMEQGLGRSLTYNPSNRVTHIETATGNIDFIYGAEGNRVVQLASGVGGGTSARTLYVGMGATGKSLYERTTRGSITEHVQFIYAGAAHGGGAFALRIVRNDGSAPAMRYYHTDHLGSVTAMSDEIGHVVDAAWGGADAGVMGYDPWGARRNPAGTPASPSSFNLQVGHREFTGHETIPEVGLINMNGRVYDPVLGRFLSPDPTVQFAANLQNYNRYSYVMNNPLRYTDPTGYAIFSGAWTDTLVGIGIGLAGIGVCAGTAGVGCVAFFGVVSAIYSATSALSSGASYQQVGVSLAVGIAGGAFGGAIGGAIVGEAAQSLGGAMLSGAIGGVVSNVVTTVALGGELSAGNILLSAASGAATAGATWAATPRNPVTMATKAQGGGGSGEAQMAAEAMSDATLGGDPHDPIELGRKGNPDLIEGPRTPRQHEQDVQARKWLDSDAPRGGGRSVFEATAGKGVEYGATKPVGGPLSPTVEGDRVSVKTPNYGRGKNEYSVHTHPKGSEFSNMDLASARRMGAPLYMGDPRGNLWVLDPVANTIMYVSPASAYVPGTMTLPDVPIR